MKTAQIIPFRAMSQLPNRVRELRKAAGLTLEQLGAMVGTSHSVISYIELGDRQLTQAWMVKLSRALGCDEADLLPISDSNKPLSGDERALLDAYRHAPTDAKQAIARVAETLSGYQAPPVEFSGKAASG